MKVIELPFVKTLKDRLGSDENRFIQVVVGPRQVGKTTGVRQVMKSVYPHSQYYCSADGVVAHAAHWIFEQWQLAAAQDCRLLVIDEIQKVENWSEEIKRLWDAQIDQAHQMKLVLLGSSALSIQNGLSESLAGRFQLHKVFHWNYAESRAAYGIGLETYLRYGGYPGSYPLLNEASAIDWLMYMRESIVDAVIGKDILSHARVKSAALFKQCFELACAYPAQEISYTKLLGQLQDKGNTNQVKYYLELLEGAFLLKQLFKYSERPVLSRSSSPKLLPLCPALYAIGLDAQLDSIERGRAFELSIGTALLRLPGQLYYWRDRNFEVDFVYRFGKQLFAIEVKSGLKKNMRGLQKFTEIFPHSKPLVITPNNFETLSKLIS